VLQAELLRDAAAQREPDDVRAVDVARVEHGDRVGDEIAPGVPGGAGGPGRRGAGVAVVVADDPPPAGDEEGAQVVVPPVA
jgi:hypothetical protein